MSPYAVQSSSGSRDFRCGLAAAIMSCHFRVGCWTCDSSTLGEFTSASGHSVLGGCFCEVLVALGSIQDPHGHLLAVLDQGPGCIGFFGWTGVRTRFYHVIFHSEGAIQSSHHHSLALCRYHLIIGLHSHTSSSAKCSIWHPRSTDASYVHRISSPKINSFVILAMCTQILSERCLRVRVKKTSFEMGRASLDTLCSV
jgi:hypothetical protein